MTTQKPDSKGCDSNCILRIGTEARRTTGIPPKSKIDVKHVILVLSGKGGVGKSTVSVNLAYALANHGRKVGLLDLDIHGPSIPKMLGIEDQKPAVLDKTIEPVISPGTLRSCPWRFCFPTQTHRSSGVGR